MKLTDEQFQIIVKHLNTVAPDGFTCPICGEKHWVISDVFFEMREYNKGSLFHKGLISLIPFVTLDCSKCHNTLLLNAVSLGIITKNEENKNPENEQGKEEHYG